MILKRNELWVVNGEEYKGREGLLLAVAEEAYHAFKNGRDMGISIKCDKDEITRCLKEQRRELYAAIGMMSLVIGGDEYQPDIVYDLIEFIEKQTGAFIMTFEAVDETRERLKAQYTCDLNVNLEQFDGMSDLAEEIYNSGNYIKGSTGVAVVQKFLNSIIDESWVDFGPVEIGALFGITMSSDSDFEEIFKAEPVEEFDIYLSDICDLGDVVMDNLDSQTLIQNIDCDGESDLIRRLKNSPEYITINLRLLSSDSVDVRASDLIEILERG